MNLASLLASGGQSLNVPLVLLLIKATRSCSPRSASRSPCSEPRRCAHLVWLVTLGALLLIPVLTAWGPLRLELLPKPTQTVAARRSACRLSWMRRPSSGSGSGKHNCTPGAPAAAPSNT